MQIGRPLDGHNAAFNGRKHCQGREKRHRYKDIEIEHWVPLIRHIDMQNRANNDVTHDGHGDVWRGIVRAMVIQFFTAFWARVVHLQIGAEQLAFASLRATAEEAALDGGLGVARALAVAVGGL